MVFLFFLLIGLIPLFIGFAVLYLMKGSNLAKALFIFLLLASLWQIDVAILTAYPFLEVRSVEILFRILRFGSVMLIPTLFWVSYMIVAEELPDLKDSKWRFIMNPVTVVCFFLWGLFVYGIGLTNHGIEKLALIQPDNSFPFYFPIYGDWGFIYQLNIWLFVLSFSSCILILRRIGSKKLRFFLLYFIIWTSVGYCIGIFNMYPSFMLFPSGIAVLLFAISIFMLSNKMHMEVVKEMNAALDDQREFLSNVVDLNPNYIYAKDELGKYTLVNQALADLYGYKKDDILGKTDVEIFSDEKKGQTLLHHDQALLHEGKTEYIDEEVHVDQEGTIRWLQTSKVPILFKKSHILLGVSNDITQRKAYEDEIIQQAHHDELTRLPNRRMFLEDLSQAISGDDEKDQRVAVMIIDLDRFKYINDTLGHDYGDSLLVQVAERLQQFLEKSLLLYSKVYRLGGDEFTLLHLRCSTEKAEQIAKRLVAAFNESFILHNQEFYITPSIGISVYPEHGEDLKTLMRNADTAMYYVKDREKNNYQLFTEGMHQHFYRKMLIEKELRGALEREELELYYQPIVRVETGDIVGVESLLRWHHAELGTISPAEFIPVSEETGLILPLGEWVIREAARQCKRWEEQGHPPVKMGINISVRQLLDKNFVENVKKLLEEADLEPSLIDLEVTESIAMFDPKVMIDRLHTLKALGVTLSMDDFGTGYSSLSYLRKYPLDTLKIDQSFIQNIEQDENNQAIVASILSMAKHLRLEVTAEGVETEADYAYLKAANCDKAQGYGIGYPVPASELW